MLPSKFEQNALSSLCLISLENNARSVWASGTDQSKLWHTSPVRPGWVKRALQAPRFLHSSYSCTCSAVTACFLSAPPGLAGRKGLWSPLFASYCWGLPECLAHRRYLVNGYQKNEMILRRRQGAESSSSRKWTVFQRMENRTSKLSLNLSDTERDMVLPQDEELFDK